MLKITIPGQPRPKKNNQVMVKGRNLLLQSKPWREYEKFCIGTKRKPGWLMQWGNVCYREPVQMTCLYWRQDRRPTDLLNLLAGTSDLLEKAGIISNDRLVVSVDGSRIMGVDRAAPRVEIEIRPLRDEGETWMEN
jgi:Holliday junction resolvase RusA-like endonuclease